MDIFTVDAFTKTAFKGNPAAVCFPGSNDVSEERMREIASEMNLSETAFILLQNPNDSYNKSKEFSLRWFTPIHEVSLCGHATLASAAVLFTCLSNKSRAIVFSTLSGPLVASRDDEDVISLDFPLNPPILVETKELQEELHQMTKLVCGDISERVVDSMYSPSTCKLLLRLSDCLQAKQLLQRLKPDYSGMTKQQGKIKIKGVIATCRTGADTEGGADFYSRYFAPWVGIDEDPVTGSAHTVLAPYWASVTKKTSFQAEQCSKRGGQLEVGCLEGGRCVLKGRAVVVLQGSICNP